MGRSQRTPIVLAHTAMLAYSIDQPEIAIKYRNLAIKEMKAQHAEGAVECEVWLSVNYGRHFHYEARGAVENLVTGYQKGLRDGAVENAR